VANIRSTKFAPDLFYNTEKESEKGKENNNKEGE